MSFDGLAVEQRDLPPPKLPLGQAIKLSYSIFFSNFSDVLRITWLWLLLVTPLYGYSVWLRFSKLSEMIAGMKKGGPPPIPPQASLEDAAMNFIPALLVALAGLSIAVAWHRLLALGERPGFSGSNLFTANVWRYLGMGIAITFAVLLPVMLVLVPLLLAAGPGPLSGGAAARPGVLTAVAIVIGVVLYFLAIGALLRLSLLLPARAVGDMDLTFKQTWIRTRGNSWRIFWGMMACAILIPLAFQILAFLFVGMPTAANLASGGFATRFAIFGTLSTLVYLLTMPITVGFLTIAYGHFFEKA